MILTSNTSFQNGYTLKVNSIKNCGNENVIKVENFDVDLDKDCNIVPKGCATISKPFKTFNVSLFVLTIFETTRIHINIVRCCFVRSTQEQSSGYSKNYNFRRSSGNKAINYICTYLQLFNFILQSTPKLLQPVNIFMIGANEKPIIF